MTIFPLARAEWIKTRQRPLSRGLFASMLGLAIMPLVLALCSLVSRSTRAFAVGALALPASFTDTGLTTLRVFTPLFAVLLIAASVGGEYAQDTWKTVLVRAPGRSGFLLAKLFTNCFAFLMAAVTSLAVYLFLLIVSASILNLTVPHRLPEPERLVGYSACIAVQFFLYASVALLAAVATRSQTGTVFVTILGLPFLNMIADRAKALAWVLPGEHLLNLEARWRYYGENKELSVVFGSAVSASTSAAIVLAFCLLCIGCAVWIFGRRDIS